MTVNTDHYSFWLTWKLVKSNAVLLRWDWKLQCQWLSLEGPSPAQPSCLKSLHFSKRVRWFGPNSPGKVQWCRRKWRLYKRAPPSCEGLPIVCTCKWSAQHRGLRLSLPLQKLCFPLSPCFLIWQCRHLPSSEHSRRQVTRVSLLKCLWYWSLSFVLLILLPLTWNIATES